MATTGKPRRTGRLFLQVSALAVVFIFGLATGVVITDYRYHKRDDYTPLTHYHKSDISDTDNQVKK